MSKFGRIGTRSISRANTKHFERRKSLGRSFRPARTSTVQHAHKLKRLCKISNQKSHSVQLAQGSKSATEKKHTKGNSESIEISQQLPHKEIPKRIAEGNSLKRKGAYLPNLADTMALVQWTRNLGQIGHVPEMLSEHKTWTLIPSDQPSQPVLYAAPSAASNYYRVATPIKGRFSLESKQIGIDYVEKLWGPLTERNGEVVYESADLGAALQGVSNLIFSHSFQEYGLGYSAVNTSYRVYTGYESNVYFDADDIAFFHTHGIRHVVPSHEDLVGLARKYKAGLGDFDMIYSHQPGKGNELAYVRMRSPFEVTITLWLEYFWEGGHPSGQIRRKKGNLSQGEILLAVKSYELRSNNFLDKDFLITSWIERNPITQHPLKFIIAPEDVYKELDALRGPYSPPASRRRIVNRGSGHAIKMSPKQIESSDERQLIDETRQIKFDPDALKELERERIRARLAPRRSPLLLGP